MIDLQFLFNGIICFLLYANVAGAQPLMDANPIDRYIDEYGNTLLYRGKAYVTYQNSIEGHQSFKSVGMVDSGTVVFDGLHYQQAPLMYDVVLDELISRHPKLLVNLIIPKAFVTSFTIGVDTFVVLRADQTNLQPGYYHQLLNVAGMVCYVKWAKEIKDEQMSAASNQRRFVETVTFYIKRPEDVVFQNITNQSALLRLFKAERRELRKHLFAAGLSYKESPEQTVHFVLNHVIESMTSTP